MEEIPLKILEIMRPHETVLAVYDVEDLTEKSTFLTKSWYLVPGKLIITSGNIYDYWLSSKEDENVMDLPLQKITKVEFIKLKNYNLLSSFLYGGLSKEFGVPSVKYLAKGVLKISTSWETSIVFPKSIEEARKIVLAIKNALEDFYPEPISISEESDDEKYYIELKVPHRHISKEEIIMRIKDREPIKEDKSTELIKQRLKELKELYEEGLITEEEYKEKKRELLSKL